MTRVNAGIDPQKLPDKLLIAEHREITRIPNAIRSGRAIVQDIPPTFRLGEGHVKFFYDKLEYLRKRYEALYEECRFRGFEVTAKHSAFSDLPPELMNDYTPTRETRRLIINRISRRGFKLKVPRKRSPRDR